MSFLRINTNSKSIFDESEKPKTSDLTNYNYVHLLKKKGILRLKGKKNFESHFNLKTVSLLKKFILYFV